MIAHSLRARLILAFLAMVSLLLVVGVASFTIHSGIQSDVASLGARRGVDLSRLDQGDLGLDIEGRWDTSGVFIATDVDVLPGPRRPRLRGAIQSLNLAESTVTLYGRALVVDETTSFDPEQESLADLSAGQRVEAICELEDGQWRARQVRTDGVKSSDKIKGLVSAAAPGQPLQARLHDLPIDLREVVGDAPDSAMAHIETATRMLLALSECRAVVRELVARPLDDQGSTGEGRSARPAAERLVRARMAFIEELDHAHGALAGRDPGAPLGALERWVDRLLDRQLALSGHMATFLDLLDEDGVAAGGYVANTFDPFLVDELQPLVNAYLGESQEEFSDQLRLIVARGAQTTRLALAVSGLALILALALGVAVWRSVHRPIATLQRAALRLARGGLDTRVNLPRQDEFGTLARAFNTMASELQRTTISIEEKELLLREVHHRVKNNMQVVSSLLAMQAGECDDPATAANLAESQGRIRSMALIHEQLYRSDDLARIDVASYLELLTQQLARSQGQDVSIAVQLRVDDVAVDFDQAMSCGLIINELVTNAFQHAFPAGGAGTIRITLGSGPDGLCRLRVTDDGRGCPAGELQGGGAAGPATLGASLVTMLVRQLDGEMTMGSEDGTDVTIDFPGRAPQALPEYQVELVP